MHDNLKYKNAVEDALCVGRPGRAELRVLVDKIGLSSEDVVPERGSTPVTVHAVVDAAANNPDTWHMLLEQIRLLFPEVDLPTFDAGPSARQELAPVFEALDRVRANIAYSVADAPTLLESDLDRLQLDSISTRESMDEYLSKWQGTRDLPDRHLPSLVGRLTEATDRLFEQLHHLRSIFDLIQMERDRPPPNVAEADQAAAQLMRRHEMTAARRQLNQALSRLNQAVVSAKAATNDAS